MPRYYFHVQRDDLHLPDVNGQDESDLSAAHAYAVRLATTLSRHCEYDEGAAPWIIQIANSSGRRELAVVIHNSKPSVATLNRKTCEVDHKAAGGQGLG
jgi:hypothetical protein